MCLLCNFVMTQKHLVNGIVVKSIGMPTTILGSFTIPPVYAAIRDLLAYHNLYHQPLISSASTYLRTSSGSLKHLVKWIIRAPGRPFHCDYLWFFMGLLYIFPNMIGNVTGEQRKKSTEAWNTEPSWVATYHFCCIFSTGNNVRSNVPLTFRCFHIQPATGRGPPKSSCKCLHLDSPSCLLLNRHQL